MKLCWDNIENIRLTKKGNFRDMVKKRTLYLKICKQCGEEFIGRKNAKYCFENCMGKDRLNKSRSIETKRKISISLKGRPGRKHTEETKQKISKANKGENNYWYGKTFSKEHKRKIGKSGIGKKHAEETKQKISKANKGENGSNWKGGYYSKGIPLYDTYAHQIEWCEEVRRNKEDLNILEVRCFKCNEWYIPTLNNMNDRIQCLKGNYKGECKFYCSDQCKNSCSIFHKSPETLMKEDAVRSGRLPWLELTREVQPELRSMVLERDEHKCVKCGNTNDLQCHHIYPVNIEPLLSADVDNCITLCKDCHLEVHKKDGCEFNQLKLEMC